MILSFEKPEKIRSTEEHNKMFSSDCGVAGTYVPNMSEEDRKKFKAKHIKGEDERIEIRVEMGSNILIIVYKNPKVVKCDFHNYKEYAKKHQNIQISMNGKLDLSFEQWENIGKAINEAKQILDL
jgi:hypothetical protein